MEAAETPPPVATAAPAERAALPRFGERLRLLRNKRYDDWWHIVFAGPIGTFLAAWIAHVRWITPNGLTWASFATKVAACPLLLHRSYGADVLVAIILQVNTVLDVMDGSLARYRKTSSMKGAFLDKITDAIGLMAVIGALAYRVFLDHSETEALLAGFLIASTYLTRIYMFWIVAYFEREREVPATLGPATLRDLGDLTFRERLIYYLRSTPRILLVGEGDMYFWMSLALIFEHKRIVLYALAAALSLRFVIIAVKRFRTMSRLDTLRRP